MNVERFVRGRRCFGRGERGVWMATDTEDGSPVLLTTGPGSVVGLDYCVDGVVALAASGTADESGPFLVEHRPPGSPARARRSDVQELAHGVAVIAARAHLHGIGLGGLRPEAVWAAKGTDRGGSTILLAPRATPFWAGASPDAGMLPGFELPYLAPEQIACRSDLSATETALGHSPLAADVWALGATIAYWATGAHPFTGDHHDQVLVAIAHGRRRPWTGDPRLAQISAAALAPVSDRPRIEELVAALSRA